MTALALLARDQEIFKVLDIGAIRSNMLAQAGLLLCYKHIDEQLARPVNMGDERAWRGRPIQLSTDP